MRWNCPHCGTNLAVADERLGSGWSFSRCYRCSGYALIRRSDVNLIKVNGAPTGERVLLPESTENPHQTPMLSQEAMQNFVRYGLDKTNAQQEQQQLRQQIQQHMQQAQPPVLQQQAIQPPPMQTMPLPTSMPTSMMDQPPIQLGLPDPLPEPHHRNTIQKLIPVGIGIAGVMAIGSGIYFYIQGQALWQKARAAAVMESNNSVTRAAVAAAAASNPAMAGAAIATNNVEAAPAPTQQQAPAAQPQPTLQQRIADARPSITVDRVRTAEAAAEFERLDRLNDNEPNPMIIRVQIDKAKIRSGPGTEYPIIALANPRTRYVVRNWNERWFKIEVHNLVADATPEISRGHATGWIRNDLVQLVPGY